MNFPGSKNLLNGFALVRCTETVFPSVFKLTFSETTAANTPNDFQPQLRHDVLEVNNYFMSGLVVSSIDKWFMGPVPQFDPRELGVADGNPSLRTTLEQARAAVDDTKWQVVSCLVNSENIWS